MSPQESCEKEISRSFNKYYKFCASSDADELKDLLSTLCSSYEKLEKFTNEKYKDNHRYIALKALRNFATHESELLNNSKALPIHSATLVHSEVQLLCLIPVASIDYVLANLRSNFTKKCVKKTVIYYDKFIDIYPAIFNLTVDLYFLTQKHSLNIVGDGYLSIVNAIQYEVEHGYSHYIDGRIMMLDGTDVNDFLENSMIEIHEGVVEKNSLPIDEDGLFCGNSLYEQSPFEQIKLMKLEDKEHLLKHLLDSKALEIKVGASGNKVGYMNREFHPIELVIANEYLESL